jgi:protein-L-isoaspartate(D-aspartate) O-methyltransferase
LNILREIYFAYLYPKAKIYGIEHIEKLAKWSFGNIRKYKNKINLKNIKIIAGDGRNGLPEIGPFDYIHSGAGNLILNYLINSLSFQGS